MRSFEDILKGKDLRSIGQSNKVVALVDNHEKFDDLFPLLFHHDRTVVMRAADAIEKITITNPVFLQPHKKEILKLLNVATHKELRWHIALLTPRLTLTKKELAKTWQTLTSWAKDKSQSKIVRVNSLQGLFNLTEQDPALTQEFYKILSVIKKEKIPSINARIKKLKNPGPQPR